MSKVYIYALLDPETTNPRYIGQTINLKVRFNNHMHFADPNGSVKDKWLHSLKSSGTKPIMVLVEETNDQDADNVELAWIKYFDNCGFALTNTRRSQIFRGWRNPVNKPKKPLRCMRGGCNKTSATVEIRKFYPIPTSDMYTRSCKECCDNFEWETGEIV